MMKKRNVLQTVSSWIRGGLVLAAFGWVTVASAVTGDCEKSAKGFSIGSSEQVYTVTLVDERDPEDGTTYGTGVFYGKISCKRGMSYTVWTSGVSADNPVDLSVDTSWEDESAPWAFFSTVPFGADTRAVMESDSWDLEEDPRSGTYYVCLSGEIGTTVTVHLQQGVIIPKGIEENPVEIRPTTKEQFVSGTMVDGEYYFVADLEAGLKYRFGLVGGVLAQTTFQLAVYGNEEESVEPEIRIDNEWADAANDALAVVPSQKGSYVISVSSMSMNTNLTDLTEFALKYTVLPSRMPAAHETETLAMDTAVSFVPGRINATKSGFYDGVIDEKLFSVSLQTDQRVFFTTVGAATNLLMRVYDAKGNVLAENEGIGNGSFDVGAALQSPAVGTYYVGVCEKLFDDEVDTPSGAEISLMMKDATAKEGMPDAFDPADDVIAGATGLIPVPVKAAGDPVAEDVGEKEIHALDFSDWADVYMIGGREGQTYQIKMAFADTNDVTDLALRAEVFTMNGTREVAVDSFGSLSPTLTGDPLTFTASAHGVYYIRVTVAEGAGLSYPAHTVHATAFQEGVTLGALQVTLMGPAAEDGAYWTLKSDGYRAPKYASGATVLLPVENGADGVIASAVSGFSTPTMQVVEISAGMLNSVVVKYNDTFDPKDDTEAGATALTIANKVGTASRSFWDSDPEDWFKFTAKDGFYYNFAFTTREGDALMRLFDANGKMLHTTNTEFSRQLSAGLYTVKVEHMNPEPEDGFYSFTYQSVNVGLLKFAKTAISVKENAAYVDIPVNRTAKEGAVRLLFATQADTALPGSEYYPTNGVLEWADGDNKAKSIRVRLIPDEVATFEENKTFQVAITPYPAEEMVEGEYMAILSGPTNAVVTLTEVSRKAPGTVGFAGFRMDDADWNAFENARTPVVTVAAGDAITFQIARTAGMDGVVRVKAETVAGKAIADTHFVAKEETFVWENGDTADKAFTVSTLVPPSYLPEAAFSVKLTLDTTGERAKLATSTVTVNVKSEKEQSTLATYVKGLPRTAGFSVKATPATGWYKSEGMDASLTKGTFGSAPLSAGENSELAFTLVGPGLLTLSCSQANEPSVSCRVQVGRDTARPITLTGELISVSGRETVKVLLTGLEGAKDVESDVTYAWYPLEAATESVPVLNKSVVPSGELLLWTAKPMTTPFDGARVYCTLASEKAKLGSPETEVTATGTNYFVNGLEPGQSYVWRVDSAFQLNGQMILAATNRTPWTFTVAAADAPTTDVSLAMDGSMTSLANGSEITLWQGVKADLLARADASKATFKVVSGKLPAGLKLNANGSITGTPNKAGVYPVLIQATDASTRKAGTTFAMSITVPEMNFAAGTFTGVLSEEDGALTNGLPALASVTITATTQGKITGKVLLGGKTYNFKDTGYTTVQETNGVRTFTAEIPLVTKVGLVPYTNVLSYTVVDAMDASLYQSGTLADEMLAPGAVSATLDMAALPDAKGSGAQLDIHYAGNAYRDNNKVDGFAASYEPYVGYYTMSLPTDDFSAGNGYLTATLDAKGKIKLSGVLADGTKISLSSVVYPVMLSAESQTEEMSAEIRIPVYFLKKSTLFGGWLRLTIENGVPVISDDSELIWNQDDASLTYSGEEGTSCGVKPVGGFYDKLVNLQRHYLDYDFSVLTTDSLELPEELLPEGYEFVANIGPNGLVADVTGDTVSFAKRVLTKTVDETTGRATKLNDWETSINPANVSVRFARATGIMTGSFSLWAEGVDARGNTVQKEVAKPKCEGVLLLYRSSISSLLDETDWISGFYTLPVKLKDAETGRTRTWTGSYPFQILSEFMVRDWTE